MRRRDERGGSESVTFLVLVPVMMLLLFGGFQAGAWWHARQSGAAAAQAACEQARTLSGGDPVGAVQRLAAQTGLEDPELTVRRTPTAVTCTITSHAGLVVDIGQAGTFTESVTMPREGDR